MATRSLIGYATKDNKVNYVYCHYDGYLEGVGVELVKYFKREEDVKELVTKDIRGITQGSADYFDDTDEGYVEVGIRDYTRPESILGVEYIYLFKDEWYYVDVYAPNMKFKKVKEDEEVKKELKVRHNRELGKDEVLDRLLGQVLDKFKRTVSMVNAAPKKDKEIAGIALEAELRKTVTEVIRELLTERHLSINTDLQNRPLKEGVKNTGILTTVYVNNKGNYLRLTGEKHQMGFYYVEVYLNGVQLRLRLNEGEGYTSEVKRLKRKPNNINTLIKLKQRMENK